MAWIPFIAYIILVIKKENVVGYVCTYIEPFDAKSWNDATKHQVDTKSYYVNPNAHQTKYIYSSGLYTKKLVLQFYIILAHAFTFTK